MNVKANISALLCSSTCWKLGIQRVSHKLKFEDGPACCKVFLSRRTDYRKEESIMSHHIQIHIIFPANFYEEKVRLTCALLSKYHTFRSRISLCWRSVRIRKSLAIFLHSHWHVECCFVRECVCSVSHVLLPYRVGWYNCNAVNVYSITILFRSPLGCGPDSSDGIATGYGLDGSGMESG